MFIQWRFGVWVFNELSFSPIFDYLLIKTAYVFSYDLEICAYNTRLKANSFLHASRSTNEKLNEWIPIGWFILARSTEHGARSTQHTAHSTQHAARMKWHAARSTEHGWKFQSRTNFNFQIETNIFDHAHAWSVVRGSIN